MTNSSLEKDSLDILKRYEIEVQILLKDERNLDLFEEYFVKYWDEKGQLTGETLSPLKLENVVRRHARLMWAMAATPQQNAPASSKIQDAFLFWGQNEKEGLLYFGFPAKPRVLNYESFTTCSLPSEDEIRRIAREEAKKMLQGKSGIYQLSSLAEIYLNLLSEHGTKLTLRDLEDYSSISKSTWQRVLRTNHRSVFFYKEAIRQLGKRINYAKSKERKEKLLEIMDFLDSQIDRIGRIERRRKEVEYDDNKALEEEF